MSSSDSDIISTVAGWKVHKEDTMFGPQFIIRYKDGGMVALQRYDRTEHGRSWMQDKYFILCSNYTEAKPWMIQVLNDSNMELSS